MRSRALTVVAAMLVGIGCGSSGAGTGGTTGSGSGGAGGGSGGSGSSGGSGGGSGGGQTDGGVDAGTDGGTDAGTDAGVGTSDGGTDGGTTTGGVSITIPNAAGWTFYQQKDGLTSSEVMGASFDEGGNLWVAGGTYGVYVMRAGSSTFQQFTLADGLHPYGYMADGSPADTSPYLEAISVSGGRAGIGFVGYMGKPPPAGHLECEDNWDSDPTPDPAIYKSGDADKLTLNGAGIDVVHYDIFSGPNVVGGELRGREKLCNVFRVVYEHGTNNVWFGANHGFAWGHADFAGDPTCDGQYPGYKASANCAGVWEHVHPAIGGSKGEILTADYRGVAVDLTQPGNVWFGGLIRTTLFKMGSMGDYYLAANDSQTNQANIIDVWPDAVPDYPTPAQRVDDAVSGIVSTPDGSIFVSSLYYGVRHLDHAGGFMGDITNLQDPHVTALARDPGDGSIWIGYTGWGFGVSQYMPDGTMRNYNYAALGQDLSSSEVSDIQVDTFSSPHRVVVSFRNGVVGIFQP